MKRINVIKIGGSSLATIEKIQNLANIIVKRNEKLVIVVSAMGSTTDNLLDLAKSINGKPKKRELDMLLATGEQMSSTLMSIALQNLNKKSIALTGNQAGIYTEGTHQKSEIKSIDINIINNYLEYYDYVVVAGFQGVNDCNDITTLGRGGSDTTAVALAARLGGDCEIYTDVQGIYTVDPRLFKNAKKVNEITYQEMLELAISGSKVLAARCVKLAFKYKVPVYVGKLDSINNGTWIRG